MRRDEPKFVPVSTPYRRVGGLQEKEIIALFLTLPTVTTALARAKSCLILFSPSIAQNRTVIATTFGALVEPE